MKTLLKNHWVIIDQDRDYMFHSISEHLVVTETCLQVHTNWPLSKSIEKGFKIVNVDIKFKAINKALNKTS